MTQYSENLNMDVKRVKTPAEYNGTTGQWEMAVKLATGQVADVQLTGSTLDLRGKAADKPLATEVEVGTTYWSIDTDPHAESIEVSNGATWAVI
jgi:hypothetical protein